MTPDPTVLRRHVSASRTWLLVAVTAGTLVTRAEGVPEGPLAAAGPRLSRICAELLSQPDETYMEFKLYVQGANIPRDAMIVVDGLAKRTKHDRDLIVESDIDTATLKYPITHYTLIHATLTAPVGSILLVKVLVPPDAWSINELQWTVPSAEEWDTDGDGLLDSWEEDGYRDANGDMLCDLPALGASPEVFDIFVEVDHMGAGHGRLDSKPTANAWPLLQEIFLRAPLIDLKPRTFGINLHIDHGQTGVSQSEQQGGDTIPYRPYIRIQNGRGSVPMDSDLVSFSVLKSQHFDAGRRGGIFHYCISGHRSGDQETQSGWAELWGDDFYLSMAEGNLGSAAMVTGYFLHELGHNLGLRHGGTMNPDGSPDREAREPNHRSVMCWEYVRDGIFSECDWGNRGRVYDLSQGTLKDLDAKDLDETVGLCGGVPVRWNEDPDSEDTDVDRSDMITNGDPHFDDNDDWGSLRFDFRKNPLTFTP